MTSQNKDSPQKAAMTPAQQPEYIVSKGDLDELLLELEYHRYNNAKIVETRIRSRPVPAPELIGEMEDMRKELEMLRTEHYENLLKPTPEQCPHWWFEQSNGRWRCKLNAGNREYEAALARAATLKENKRVLESIDECACTHGEWFTIDDTQFLYLNYSTLSKRLDELRRQAGEQR